MEIRRDWLNLSGNFVWNFVGIGEIGGWERNSCEKVIIVFKIRDERVY